MILDFGFLLVEVISRKSSDHKNPSQICDKSLSVLFTFIIMHSNKVNTFQIPYYPFIINKQTGAKFLFVVVVVVVDVRWCLSGTADSCHVSFSFHFASLCVSGIFIF